MVRDTIERSSFDVLGHARRASLNYKVMQVLWLRDQGLTEHDVNDIWVIEIKFRNVEHKVCVEKRCVQSINDSENIISHTGKDNRPIVQGESLNSPT